MRLLSRTNGLRPMEKELQQPTRWWVVNQGLEEEPSLTPLAAAWRAAAYMLAQQNRGSSATTESIMDRIEVLAKTLRCKIVTHLVVNKHLRIDSWAPDDQASKVTEAGEPATSAEAFIECLQRPLHWACGLTLAALAQLQRVNLVILMEKRSTLSSLRGSVETLMSGRSFKQFLWCWRTVTILG